MAKSPPAWPCYAQDILVGTALMTKEEVGIYFYMLNYQWVHRGLPSDQKSLRLLLNIRRDVPLVVVSKFKVCGDGMLRNERMEAERAKQEAFKAKQAANGKAGGRPRANPNETQAFSQTEAKDNPSLNPEPNPNTNPKKAFQSSVFSLQSSDKREREDGARPAWQQSLESAIACCTSVGIPRDFIETIWLQHDGTSWIDIYGRPISNFASYAASRFKNERSYRTEKSFRKPESPDDPFLRAPKK